ncbi:MAG: HNH endonuclease [Alphaproteobacteria bacterium]|nr:HNH endonuclease [Alphaproteobacteria bacterium]
MPKLSDVVDFPGRLLGLKAVWGPTLRPVISFGGNEDEIAYKRLRTWATRAQERAAPFVILIGGGSEADANATGRVLEIIELGNTIGRTTLFTTDEALARWPYSIFLRSVWTVSGWPRVVEELGLPDRSILTGSMDGIIRPEGIDDLWERLRERDLMPGYLPVVPNFVDGDKVVVASTFLPKPILSAEEGKIRFKVAREAERDPALAKEAKRLNAERNDGRCTCEACRLSANSMALFDAHHISPIHAGARKTAVSELAVLCPTCHRIAHVRALKMWLPLPVSEIRTLLNSGAFSTIPPSSPS